MPKNQTSFKPGQSGNPKGKPKQDPEIKALQDLTKDSYRRIALKYLNMNMTEIMALKENKSVSMLEWAFVKCILQIHKKGDYTALDRIMDRIIGKVKDEIEVTDSPHALAMALIRKKNQQL